MQPVDEAKAYEVEHDQQQRDGSGDSQAGARSGAHVDAEAEGDYRADGGRRRREVGRAGDRRSGGHGGGHGRGTAPTVDGFRNYVSDVSRYASLFGLPGLIFGAPIVIVALVAVKAFYITDVLHEHVSLPALAEPPSSGS